MFSAHDTGKKFIWLFFLARTSQELWILYQWDFLSDNWFLTVTCIKVIFNNEQLMKGCTAKSWEYIYRSCACFKLLGMLRHAKVWQRYYWYNVCKYFISAGCVLRHTIIHFCLLWLWLKLACWKVSDNVTLLNQSVK